MTEYERFLASCPRDGAGVVERELHAALQLRLLRLNLLSLLRAEFFRRRLLVELTRAPHGIIYETCGSLGRRTLSTATAAVIRDRDRHPENYPR